MLDDVFLRWTVRLSSCARSLALDPELSYIENIYAEKVLFLDGLTRIKPKNNLPSKRVPYAVETTFQFGSRESELVP